MITPKKILIFIILFFTILTNLCFPQKYEMSLDDTTRFFPDVKDFPQDTGWQIVNRNDNIYTRHLSSQTLVGYRYLVDLNSSPKTGISFQVVVTLVRNQKVIDPTLHTSVTRAQYAFNRMVESTSKGYVIGAKPLKYGDKSFEAQKTFNTYRIFIQRGNYLIDITGAKTLSNRPDLPSLKKTCHYLARFIDSRVFGARLGLFTPIQTLKDPTIPLVAGKKMVLYASVETEKNQPFPKHFLLTVDVGDQQGFLKKTYQIPLGAKKPIEFEHIHDFTDGSIWKNECAEPVKINKENKTFFKINLSPKFETRLYRFYLDPKMPDFAGDYIFKVRIENPRNGSKLWDHVYKITTRPSGLLRVAIVPVPVGYWAPPEKWKIDEWIWLTRMKNQSWEPKSISELLNSIPKDTANQIVMHPRSKKYLKKFLPKAEGKQKFIDSTYKGREYMKGVFPLAEENFEITIVESFPDFIDLDPHSQNIEPILKSLEMWRKRNNFDRVIGIVPGKNPTEGGVSFYLERISGQQFWYGKKVMIIPIDAPPFQYAHELAQTYGGVDEFIPSNMSQGLSNLEPKPLNSPIGTDGGHTINNGYWVQKKKFMGTPLKPVYSLMGVKKPAWIPTDVYIGLFKLLFRKQR